MFRINTLLASLAATALTLAIAAPVRAQAPAFRAVPVTPLVTASTVIVGDSMWKCGPDGCTAANVTTRPAVACELAAKKIGKIASFSVGTKSFDETALAKCNEKARS